MSMNIQDTYRTQNRLDQKRNSSRHIIIKCTKQRKTIKSSKGKGQETYNGRPIRITPDFSPETRKARISVGVIQILREYKYQSRLLYPKKTLNFYKWRQKQIHTTSFHKYSPTKDNRWKTPIQYPRISQKVIFFQ